MTEQIYTRAAFIAAFGSALSFGQKVDSYHVAPNYYSESVQVGSQHFNSTWLRKWSRQLIQREGHRSLVFSEFYVDPKAHRLFQNGKITINYSYRLWEKAYQERINRPYETACMLWLDGTGLLSIRYQDGRLEHFHLGNDVPAITLARDRPTHVLQVVTIASNDYKQSIDVFIRTDQALTRETGLEMLAMFEQLPFETISLNIRNDAWFIANGHFPVFDQFEKPEAPPTHNEYYESTTLHCAKSPERAGSCNVLMHLGGRPAAK